VAAGTPEALAAMEHSYTGQFLKSKLLPAAPTHEQKIA
jgi:excinuclease UvrABC ATPase subunit